MTTSTDPPDPLPPHDLARAWERVGATKVQTDLTSIAVLGGLAGAFISLGAMLFTILTTDPALGYGPTQLVGGIGFSLGLVLVVVAGAELFTGDTLSVIAWVSGKVPTGRLIRFLTLVYFANFGGALLTVLLVFGAEQFELADSGVGGRALTIAHTKVEYGFGQALALGILCNALVALAVWMALAARGVGGKVIAVVFPITAFVAAGFEHSVANMYFLPLGLLVKGDAAAEAASGLDAIALNELTWSAFVVDNLIPVTLGNVIGGALLVGLVYWFVYLRSPTGWFPRGPR